jgi:hypothetical protein
MPAMRSNSPHALRQFGPGNSAETTEDCGRLVLDVYRAALRHLCVDPSPYDTCQNAFDMAVCTYSERNPGVPDKAARQAVTDLICRNLIAQA